MKSYIRSLSLSATLLGAFSVAPSTASAQVAQVLITEFMYDPSACSDNIGEFVELYNAGSSAIDVTGWTLSDNAASVTLSGTIDAGGYYILGKTLDGCPGQNLSADQLLGSIALSNGGGGDRIILNDGTSDVDRVDYVDPTPSGTSVERQAVDGAPVDTDSTAAVTSSDFGDFQSGTDGGSPRAGYSLVPPAARVLITEFMYDTTCPSDNGEWIELYNAGTGAADLTGWTLEDATGNQAVLSGSLAPGAYVIATKNDEGCVGITQDFRFNFALNNSTDTIILRDETAAIVDQLSYDDPVAAQESVERQADANGNPVDTDNTAVITSANFGDFVAGPTNGTPRAGYGDANVCNPASCNDNNPCTTDSCNATTNACENTPIANCGSACGDAATLISAIQGSGDATPLDNQAVVIEGVVVADFRGSDNLNGFYVQEEDSDVDGNAATSEGIFVFDRDNLAPSSLAVGDVVRVSGTAAEGFEQTQVTSVTSVSICSGGASVTPTTVNFPLNAVSDLEAFEGMLIRNTSRVFVSENFNHGRFGQILISFGNRLFQPTDTIAPGAAALAQDDLNTRNSILLDDGSNRQNPENLPFLSNGLPPRGGSFREGIEGVVGFAFGAYNLRTNETITFSGNDRPTSAAVTGRLKVAAFNVLNYFVTIDNGGTPCGPNGGLGCRGADSAEELARQRVKIVDALRVLDADVVGLIEIQNDNDISIADLVAGVNDVVGSGTYNFVATGPIGGDAIKVGFIYKVATVEPTGSFAVLDQSVDSTFLENKNRPALAQTFRELSTGESFTAAINHFKSKGSPCDDVGDPNLNDGQGNCSQTRARAATALVNWISTDPTNSDDPDFLLIGDFNAYRQEDAIRNFISGGYIDAVASRADTSSPYGPGDSSSVPYSFVFGGRAGALDHALATASMDAQITEAFDWHINTDESRNLDYNQEFNPAEFFSPDLYRSSDHDPLVVGLNLVSENNGGGDDVGPDAGEDAGQDVGPDVGGEDAADVGGEDAADVGGEDAADVGGGSTTPDAGTTPDTSVAPPAPDVGSTTPDTGTPAPDAGSDPVDGEQDVNVNCQTVPFTDVSLLSLLLSMGFGYIRRRR